MENQPAQPSSSQPIAPQTQPSPSVTPTPVQAPITPEKGGSKHILLFFVGVVVVLALIGGVYWFVTNRTSVQNVAVKPYNSYQQTVTVSPPQTSTASATSDQQINQDMDSVNSSMNNLSQDEKSADQGLNDQSVNLN